MRINKDKKAMYAVSLITLAVLLVALFINVKSSSILTAILLVPLTAATLIFIRKRSSFSINKREVLLLTAVVAVLYAVLTEMSGLYFGYYKNPYFMDIKSMLRYALPLAVIIVLSEIIRSVLLAQKK